MKGRLQRTLVECFRYEPLRNDYLFWVLAISSLIHLLMVWGEVSLTHPTAHARLAIWEMVSGRYKNDFWIGMVLSFLGGLIAVARSARSDQQRHCGVAARRWL